MDYTFKTISRKVLGDLHTPVSIYLKVRDIYPESALLESSDFHGNENSLSYITLCPLASIGINNGECTAIFPDGESEVTTLTETFDVADAMNAFLKRFLVEGLDKKVCRLFGYTAFDAVRYFENIPVMEAHHEENDAPDMLYILYKYVLVFNHFKNELTLVELPGESSNLQEIETLIENRNYASYNFQTIGPETSPISGEEYKAMVREGIRHCLRGDVFQIVLSRRFEQPFKGDDFKVYRALRSINPSPYLFYFDFGGFRIFGSSPETHCKVADGHASIDPIAGTAFRTGDVALDRQRTEALLAVQYTVKPELAREFRKISAMGITMLIDSSDPNLTEEMICDYMGLYDDSVKVMSTAGCHMYKNAVTYTEHCSAPAAYKGNPVALAALVSSAVKIKKSSLLLAVLYALSCVAGVVMFAYTSFSGSGSVLGSAAVLLYCLISTVVSAILYLTGKP